MKMITIVFSAGLLLAALASAAPADTRLVDAVKAHDAAAARTLIGQGVDVVAPTATAAQHSTGPRATATRRSPMRC